MDTTMKNENHDNASATLLPGQASIRSENVVVSPQSQSQAPRIRMFKPSSSATTATASDTVEGRELQGVVYDGDYDFIDIDMEDAEIYTTDIYPCDDLLNRLPNSTLEEPLVAGDSIRICIQPTALTIDRGVLIRRIDQFKFTKDVWQGATSSTVAGDSKSGEPLFVQPVAINGREQEDTLLTCEPGSEVCVFKTVLHPDFFLEDGRVKGMGYAFLEFTENKVSDAFSGVNVRRNRRTQDTDINFAGISELEIEFAVKKSASKGFVGDASDNWEELNQGARYGTIVAVLAVLLCFICALGYCCLYLYKREKETEMRIDGSFPKEVKVNPKASFFDLFMQSWNGNLNYGHDEDFEDDCESVVNGGPNKRPLPQRLSHSGPQSSRDERVGARTMTDATLQDDPAITASSVPDRPTPRLSVQNKMLRPVNVAPGTTKTASLDPQTSGQKKPLLRPRPPPLKPMQEQNTPTARLKSPESTPSRRPYQKRASLPSDLSQSLHSAPSYRPQQKLTRAPPGRSRSIPINSASSTRTPSTRTSPSIASSQKSGGNRPKKGRSLPNRKSSMSGGLKPTGPKRPLTTVSPNPNKSALKSAPKRSPSLSKKNSTPKSTVPVNDENKKQLSRSKPDPAEDTQSDGSTSKETEDVSSSKESDGQLDDARPDSEIQDIGKRANDLTAGTTPNQARQSIHSIEGSTVNLNEWISASDHDEDGAGDNHVQMSTPKSSTPTLDSDDDDDDDDEDDENDSVSISIESAMSEESDFYPDPFDVALGLKNHIGTMVLEMTIRKVASFNDGAPFSKKIFQQIEIDLKGRACYVQEGETWKAAGHAVKMAYFEAMYAKEVKQDMGMELKRAS